LPGQVDKALVEFWVPVVRGLQHRTLLIVHQHFRRDPTEVFEAANYAFVGVFGIFTLGAPEMEPPLVPQFVHDEMHFASLSGNLDHHLTPIALQLLSRFCLESHGGLSRSQTPLRLNTAQRPAEYYSLPRIPPPGSHAGSPVHSTPLLTTANLPFPCVHPACCLVLHALVLARPDAAALASLFLGAHSTPQQYLSDTRRADVMLVSQQNPPYRSWAYLL